jgi:predicted transcriptional regulator
MAEKFVLVSLEEKKAKKIAETISNNTCRKILSYLSERKDASSSQISKDLNIPISTVNYNLKSLIQSNLVETKEFKYSPKGREMDLYKIAKKFIVISPGDYKGIKEKLKTIIPVVLISGVGAILVRYFSKLTIGFEKVGEIGSVGITRATPNYALWFFAGCIFSLIIYSIVRKIVK